MKERPLIFNSDMVRAILENRKFETRRMRSLDLVNKNPNDFQLEALFLEKPRKDLVIVGRFKNLTSGELIAIPCPYGKPQDLFWVRETWREALSETHECYAYRADMKYRCNKPTQALNGGWKPSIHMPKNVARIWSECTSIGVERLQQITDEGAIAEGIESRVIGQAFYRDYLSSEGDYMGSSRWRFESPVDSYRSLWESINGPGSWDLNKWVWVVGVKKIERIN